MNFSQKFVITLEKSEVLLIFQTFSVCAAGYYGDAVGGNADNCSPCPIGTWNAMVGQMNEAACTSCTDGKTTINNGTASEHLCGEFIHTHLVLSWFYLLVVLFQWRTRSYKC